MTPGPLTPANCITNGLPLTALPGPLSTKVILDAPGAGNWQGAMLNPTTGERFIAEAQKIGTASEDCLFHRFSPAGVYLDTMRAKADKGVFIHPTGWGVDGESNIYVTWNVPNQKGSGIVRFRYAAGKTITRADTFAVAPSLPGNLQIALSPTRTVAVIRRNRAATAGYPNGSDQFTKYSLAALWADKPVALSPTLSVPKHSDRVVQGFTIESDLLFCLTGFTHTTKVLEKYDLKTSKPLVNYDLTPLAGEPEGLDHNTIGMKRGKGDARHLELLDANL